MTFKVPVYVACGAGRVLSCHLHVEVVGGHAQDAMLQARLHAEDAGWSHEQHGTALLDVCPACGMAYEAGIRDLGLHLPARERLPDAPLPRTVAEAAAWDRWRERQEAKRPGQRSPEGKRYTRLSSRVIVRLCRGSGPPRSRRRGP